MMHDLDLPRIRATAELLDHCHPDNRLVQLRNLVVSNGGIWAVMDEPAQYLPFVNEVSLFGIHAFAEAPEALPAMWLRAARRILEPDAAPSITARPSAAFREEASL